MSDELAADPVLVLAERFAARASEELSERLSAWKTDLSREEEHAVLGALLARQVTLASELALSPSFWNGHVAPLLLRAMADVYISFAWVSNEPLERSRQFIRYGLGQAKLQLEHRKADVATREPLPGELRFVDRLEAWINQQRFTFLTDVDLGSWSGLTTRKMAEEAGCLDFYNYVYTPFRACTHSMWNHIGLYNLERCTNPLHRYHRVGAMLAVPLDVDFLYNAAKYVQKTFACFDERYGIEIGGQSAFDLLRSGLNELASSSGEAAAISPG